MKIKNKTVGCAICVLTLVVSSVNAVTVEMMIEKSRQSKVPVFSALADEPAAPARKKRPQQEESVGTVTPANFAEQSLAAQAGDVAAQKRIREFLGGSIRRVYAGLNGYGSLFFSPRKPAPEFDIPVKNYALFLDSLFAETCNRVTVPKKEFGVTTKSGSSYHVGPLQFQKANQTLAVKVGEVSTNIPLADLIEKDRLYIDSALMDQLFESSSKFKISVNDGRPVKRSVDDMIVKVTNPDTGRTIDAAFSGVTAESTPRSIVLANKGEVPLTDLVVEYQSFLEQTVMGFPKDFPDDYRVVGMMEIPILLPGETKEIPVELPEIITAKSQTVRAGSLDVSVAFPSDANSFSKGRNNGIVVKVHRFTPYGERLERQYKSSGVPPAKWDCLAPVNADIR